MRHLSKKPKSMMCTTLPSARGMERHTKYRTVFECTEKQKEIDIAMRLCWSLELYFMPELPRGEFGVWRPWKIETQQLGGYDFREKHRPTTLFREVACVNTSEFLLAVVAFLTSRPRRSNITAGSRADFRRSELTLKNTTEKSKKNLKKHGHSSTSNIGWHLCELRDGFHCLAVDPDQFWVGVTCAELKRRNTERTELTNARSDNRGCSALELLLNERDTPLVALRPHRSGFKAGSRADFREGGSALKSTAEKGQNNLKKHNHTSTSSLRLHLCGLHDGFRCLAIAPGHFWVRSTCAELKQIDTKITNAKSHNRGCSALEPLLNERNTTPLVEIARVHMGRMGEFDDLCASPDLVAFVGQRGGRSVAGESGKTIGKQTSNSKQNEQERRASSSIKHKETYTRARVYYFMTRSFYQQATPREVNKDFALSPFSASFLGGKELKTSLKKQRNTRQDDVAKERGYLVQGKVCGANRRQPSGQEHHRRQRRGVGPGEQGRDPRGGPLCKPQPQQHV